MSNVLSFALLEENSELATGWQCGDDRIPLPPRCWNPPRPRGPSATPLPLKEGPVGPVRLVGPVGIGRTGCGCTGGFAASIPENICCCICCCMTAVGSCRDRGIKGQDT